MAGVKPKQQSRTTLSMQPTPWTTNAITYPASNNIVRSAEPPILSSSVHQLNLCVPNQIHTANLRVELTTPIILDNIRICGNGAATPVLVGATHDNSRCALGCDSRAITVVLIRLSTVRAAFAEELIDRSRHIIGIWAAVASLADNQTVLAWLERGKCIDY